KEASENRGGSRSYDPNGLVLRLSRSYDLIGGQEKPGRGRSDACAWTPSSWRPTGRNSHSWPDRRGKGGCPGNCLVSGGLTQSPIRATTTNRSPRREPGS